jgi:hypothetical protein
MAPICAQRHERDYSIWSLKFRRAKLKKKINFKSNIKILLKSFGENIVA